MTGSELKALMESLKQDVVKFGVFAIDVDNDGNVTRIPVSDYLKEDADTDC